MEKAYQLLNEALQMAKEKPQAEVEVVEVNFGYDVEGRPITYGDCAIQVRIVAYPRHAKNDNAKS